MPTASPTNDKSTHHVMLGAAYGAASTAALILCDSRGNANEYAIRKDPMPRMSLKMYSGEPKWDDLEPPWTPIAMSEWAGGRGRKEYDIDKTRYSDGEGVDTTKSGQVVLAGQPVYITNSSHNKNWPYCDSTGGNVDYITIDLDGSYPYYAQKFTASATFDVKHLHLVLKYLENDTGGNSVGTLTITIRNDNSGVPGTLVTNGTTTVVKTSFSETDHWEDVNATFTTAPSLTSGNVYWIRLDGSASSADCWWSILGESNNTLAGKKSLNGTDWVDGAGNIFYRTRAARTKIRDFLFEYKDQVYWLRNVAAGTNLYYLGDHGVATGGATTTLTDSTKSWTVNEFAGCIVRLVSGTGATQLRNWAQIASNTATVLTFSTALYVAPAAQTEYVIVASNKYTLIGNQTVTGLTAAATTDILAANGYIYFAQGDSVVVRRAEFYNNAGTWTRQYDDETEEAHFLIDGGDSTGTYIMRALKGTATLERAASVVAWGDLTWSGTAIPVGSARKRINGLQLYEDGDLWIFKDDSVWRIINGDAYWVPISAMASVADDRNGVAHIMHQVYMFFSLHNTILRYYDGNLDEVGIDMDDGLPINRKGSVSCFASYPGRLYAAVNGGADNYSAVFAWNGLGWCEVYRAFATGLEIDSILLQPIPGEHVDRLWIACGDDILWIPVSEDPFRVSTSITYNFYPFKWGGMLETGWCYVGMKDVDKYWHSVKLFNENYTSGQTISGRYARADYAYLFPTTGGWNKNNWLKGMGTVLDPSDYFDAIEKECDIEPSSGTTAGGVSDEGMAFRFVIRTNSNQLTPKITAVVIDTAIRVPVKNIYSIVFRLKENDRDLQGDVDTQVTSTILSNLTAAEGSATPLRVSSTSTLLDAKTVFLDNLTMRPYYNTPDESGYQEGWICQAQLIEI